jgi:hypothetical protein
MSAPSKEAESAHAKESGYVHHDGEWKKKPSRKTIAGKMHGIKDAAHKLEKFMSKPYNPVKKHTSWAKK